jgi:hypothetical protein
MQPKVAVSLAKGKIVKTTKPCIAERNVQAQLAEGVLSFIAGQTAEEFAG